MGYVRPLAQLQVLSSQLILDDLSSDDKKITVQANHWDLSTCLVALHMYIMPPDGWRCNRSFVSHSQVEPRDDFEAKRQMHIGT